MQIYSPRQLIAAVPHSLGFHPTQSLVVVVLDGHTLEATMRFDWPAAFQSEHLSRVIDDCIAPGVVFIDYVDDDSRVSDIAEWERSLPPATMLDHLRVVGQHWRSVLCHDESCCPKVGHPITEFVDEDTLQFIVEGSAPFANRDEMRASLESLSLTSTESLRRSEAFIDSTTVVAGDVVDAVQELCTSGKVLSWNELAIVCRGLSDVRVRDAVLRHLLDEQSARVNTRITLLDAVTRAPHEYVAVLATSLAGCVWLDGNGVLARVAIDRALESDADYSLARLLDRGMSAGVPSRVWADSLAQLTREQCLAGAA